MSHPRAVVDVVRPNHRTGKFLHHIVGFIAGATGRAGGHDGVRAIFRLDGRETAAGELDRFIPGDGLELATALAADHRALETGGQQVGVVQKIPTVIALEAELPLVGPAVGAFGPHHLVVFNQQVDFATGAAIGAHGNDFFHDSHSCLLTKNGSASPLTPAPASPAVPRHWPAASAGSGFQDAPA